MERLDSNISCKEIRRSLKISWSQGLRKTKGRKEGTFDQEKQQNGKNSSIPKEVNYKTKP